MKYLPYLIILFLLGVIFYQYKNPKIKEKPIIDTITHTDTFIDTLYYSKPYPVEVKVTDTIFIDKDSIKQEGDSLILPRETKVYEDSIYKATISGFKPILEDITVYPKTYTIEKTKTVTVTKKDHFNIGLQVGSGYGIFSRQPDVYVGIGIQYNLW